MKKTKLALGALAIFTVALLSFNQKESPSIRGTVSPADKAIRAWAVSADDTLHVEINDWKFELNGLKAGTYSIIIEAREPFKHIRKKDVVVSEESPVANVGQIKLETREEFSYGYSY